MEALLNIWFIYYGTARMREFVIGSQIQLKWPAVFPGTYFTRSPEYIDRVEMVFAHFMFAEHLIVFS